MTPDTDPPYTIRRVQQILGISRAIIDRLIRAGFVSPTRGKRNEHRFGFQDLMLLRTAYSLQQARIPPRKILSSLRNLKASLPEELPLTGMRITAVGTDVAVRDRQGAWDADSGQLLMDFEVAPAGAELAFIDASPAAAAAAVDGDAAEALVARGALREGADPSAAEADYRAAIAIAPDFVDAYLNLGALLCDLKRCDEATRLYEDALPRLPQTAALHFNHGIALEDAGQLPAAVVSYEKAVALDKGLADAYFNLGRLEEALGDARAALRHFNTYRRLTRES